MKAPASEDVCWLGFETTTFTAPTMCAGVVPVMVVELATFTEVKGKLPTRSAKITEAPAWKPVPVIVTLVPPTVRPWFGLMESTVGAGLPAENGKIHTPTAASMRG